MRSMPGRSIPLHPHKIVTRVRQKEIDLYPEDLHSASL